MTGRPKYAVLAWRSDCGDVDVFTIEDSYGRDFWATFDEARSVMKADYEVTSEEYAPNWSRDRRDKRRRRILKASASFSVPIWDAERKRESSLKCRWKVVEI